MKYCIAFCPEDFITPQLWSQTSGAMKDNTIISSISFRVCNRIWVWAHSWWLESQTDWKLLNRGLKSPLYLLSLNCFEKHFCGILMFEWEVKCMPAFSFSTCWSPDLHGAWLHDRSSQQVTASYGVCVHHADKMWRWGDTDVLWPFHVAWRC